MASSYWIDEGVVFVAAVPEVDVAAIGEALRVNPDLNRLEVHLAPQPDPDLLVTMSNLAEEHDLELRLKLDEPA